MARQKLPETLTERLDRTPPFLVFALARKGRGAAIHRPKFSELAAASKIPLRTFGRIVAKISWAGVPVDQVDAICAACNFKLFRAGAQAQYIRRNVKRGIMKLPKLKPFQQQRFERKLEQWLNSNAVQS